MNWTLISFCVYLTFTIAVGLWAARRSGGSEEGFFLGDRKISAFVVALSAVSSGRSAWLVIGASGAAWAWGLSALWLFPGYVAAEYVLLSVIGPRLRVKSAAAGAITIPEVLAGVRGPDGESASSRLPVRQIAGAIVVLFLITYVSAQLAAGGKALESLFPDVDGQTWGLCITACIVLGYTLLGGYQAVAITDVLQALFMGAGLVVLPLLGIAHVGGFGALFEQLEAIDPVLTSLLGKGGWKAALTGVAIGLGSFGSPPILVRSMSIDDPANLRRAARIGTTWNAVMALGALFVGLVGRALYTSKDAFPDGDAEHLYPMLGELLSSEYLFAGFAGVLLAALFAAIMSTCDSQLLVIASAFVRDFRGKRGSDAPSDKPTGTGLTGSRVAVLVALLAAVAISFGAERSVKDFVLFSWDALGAAFGPAILFVLFDRRTTARGVLAGMLIGVATVMLWGKSPELKDLVHQRIPGFAFSALAVWALRRRA